MEGCSAPLVVKFADTQKDKEQKRLQQLQTNLWSVPGTNGLSMPLTQSATTIASPVLPNPPQQQSPFLAADAIPPSQTLQLFQQLQGLQTVNIQQQLLQGTFDYICKLPVQIVCTIFERMISFTEVWLNVKKNVHIHCYISPAFNFMLSQSQLVLSFIKCLALDAAAVEN